MTNTYAARVFSISAGQSKESQHPLDGLAQDSDIHVAQRMQVSRSHVPFEI